MEKKKLQTLIIDKEFKLLVQPLTKTEIEMLENNILSEGCREPIAIHNGSIIDGFNRYAICTKHHIPFYVQEIEFNSRAEIISWICANQLKRNDLTDERKIYLIGKRLEAERLLSKNPSAVNNLLAVFGTAENILKERRKHHRSIYALKLSMEYEISCTTIIEYHKYAKALDILKKYDEKMVEDILVGNLKLSRSQIIKMSKHPTEKPVVKEKFISKTFIKPQKEQVHKITIKDMPTYDPDAEITSLTYTIPSWIGSIDRVLQKQDFNNASENAKQKLKKALDNLKFSADTIILSMEDTNGRI